MVSNSNTAEGPPPTGSSMDRRIGDWAEREHARRQAWLDGPSEREKAEMRARLTLEETARSDDESYDPTRIDARLDGWVARERARRQAWAEGADLSGAGTYGSEPVADVPGEIERTVRTGLKRAEYASRGLLHRMVNTYFDFVDDMIAEGRKATYEQPRKRPIDY